ncbi:MAG: PBP1A family penicillin-binding protein [Beijerinckiaceae bacterium]|nr:PBP1A family penicillin-binding protein [Beijerinckiaceae bacterium]
MARKSRERIEPRFDRGDDDGLRVTRDDRPAPGSSSRRRAGGGRLPKTKSRRARRGILKRLVYFGLVASIWGVIALTAVIAYFAMQLPPIDQLTVPKRPPNIAIMASDGTLIANRGETGGSAVPIKELPVYVPRAFVAIEDRRFYSHFGIDPVGILRAVFRNLTSSKVEGGSTLTQQLAKNIFLTQERTVSRKAQEAILALWLERKYSKDQILELYMNRVYFGSGVYGIEGAAQKYFGKSARALTVAEAAVLAGLMKSPSKLAPNRNPEGAAARAADVIRAMQDAGYIDEITAKVALASPGQARRQLGAGSTNYAADYVMDLLDDFIGSFENDIVVMTTISPPLQNAAEKALVEEIDAKGGKLNVSQGALVAMSPDGAVRALVGGHNYSESQFNRAVTARRQPGSSFKPFVYLAALEKGYTPDSTVQDAPVNIRGYAPENYTREYFGTVSLTKALSMSLNTPAVRLGQEVGPRNVVRVAQRLGISSPLQANASLPLGTSEVSVMEMAGAFSAFANGGTGVIPFVITNVKSTGGKVLYSRKPTNLGQVIAPPQAAMMNAMMRETLLTGTAKKGEIPGGWQAAGKTGTTQDFKDAWFVGYTGYLVAAVWLGNDDGEKTKHVTGGGLPTEIWSRFMRAAHQGVKPVPLPGDWKAYAQPETPLPNPVSTDPLTSFISKLDGVSPQAPPDPVRARSQSGSPQASNDRRVFPPAKEEKGFFDKLFGG